MERYDYRSAVIEDIKAYIEENDIKVTSENKEELYQQLDDCLFVSDNVTGNASGGYFCNAHKAEECLMHNLDLLGEAVEEFGGAVDVLKSGAEACDVIIRCYLLGECLSDVLDELEQEDED